MRCHGWKLFVKFVVLSCIVLMIYNTFLHLLKAFKNNSHVLSYKTPDSSYRLWNLNEIGDTPPTSQAEHHDLRKVDLTTGNLIMTSSDQLLINNFKTKLKTIKQPTEFVQRSTVPSNTRPNQSTEELIVPILLGEDGTWNFTVSSNPHPFVFLKTAKDACKVERVFILAIIHSKPSHVEKRETIRKTWGSKKLYNQLNIVTVFVLGLANDRETEKAVQRESVKHHDIIQEDFMDSYRNLTHKAIAVLRWVTEHCSNAEFVLKTDDDVIVNIFSVAKILRKQMKISRNVTQIICELIDPSVERDKNSKWYVSEIDYPYKHYPPYCMGAAFILPGPIVPLMYHTSSRTKFFWIDDVYATGMLAYVNNISHINSIKVLKHDEDDYLMAGFGSEPVGHITGPSSSRHAFKHWQEILSSEVLLNDTEAV